MPNQPKNPIVGWRIPKDVADEIRDIAKDEGVPVGEFLGDMFRGKRAKYREERRRNGGRPLRGRIIDNGYVKYAAPSSRRSDVGRVTGTQPPRRAA